MADQKEIHYGPKDAQAKASGPNPDITDEMYNKLYTVLFDMLKTHGPMGTIGELVILPVNSQTFMNWNVTGKGQYPDIAQRDYCNVLPYNLGARFEDGYEAVLFDAFKESRTVKRAQDRFDDPDNQETYQDGPHRTITRRTWRINPSAYEANQLIDSSQVTSAARISSETVGVEWSETWLSEGFNYGSCFFRVKENAQWVDVKINTKSEEFYLEFRFGTIANVIVTAGEWFNSSIVMSTVNNPNNFNEGWTKLETPESEWVLGKNGACNAMINNFYVYKELQLVLHMQTEDYAAASQQFEQSQEIQIGCWKWDVSSGSSSYKMSFDEASSTITIDTRTHIPVILANLCTRFQFSH